MSKSINEIERQLNNGTYFGNKSTTGLKKKKTIDEIEASLSNYDFGVDDSYIKSFYTDLKKYQTDTVQNYNEIKYSNYAKTIAENESRRKDLKVRADTIRAYLNSRKENMDKQSYNSIIDSLNSFDKYSTSIWKLSETANKQYSPFKTEDEYNKAIEAQKQRDKMLAFDIDAGNSEIEGLKKTKSDIEKLESEKQGIINQYKTKIGRGGGTYTRKHGES